MKMTEGFLAELRQKAAAQTGRAMVKVSAVFLVIFCVIFILGTSGGYVAGDEDSVIVIQRLGGPRPYGELNLYVKNTSFQTIHGVELKIRVEYDDGREETFNACSHDDKKLIPGMIARLNAMIDSDFAHANVYILEYSYVDSDKKYHTIELEEPWKLEVQGELSDGDDG